MLTHPSIRSRNRTRRSAASPLPRTVAATSFPPIRYGQVPSPSWVGSSNPVSPYAVFFLRGVVHGSCLSGISGRLPASQPALIELVTKAPRIMHTITAQGNVYVYSSEGGSYSSATELTQAKAVAAHKGHQVLCVALSPDGRHVAAKGCQMLMLYQIA
jgi:hypothetical protein